MYVYRKVVRHISQYNKVYAYTTSNGNKVTNQNTIEYIKSLKIPPAYTDVKINLNKNAKLLVTGYDVKGKKQYIYNQKWVEKRSQNKFCNMLVLGQKLPKINRDINRLLDTRINTKEKMIAVMIKIIMHCHFRIGNSIGKDVYNSFGVSTLSGSHIVQRGNQVVIDFRGKRGVQNTCIIRDKNLAKILLELKRRAKNKNEQIFHYNGDNNRKIYVTSQDVNNFLKQYGNITTKDFRTWYANVYFISATDKLGAIPNTITNRKKNVREAIKIIADKLHHTVAICKKKYIDNNLIDLYIEHPIKYKRNVLDNYTNAENAFIKYMKLKC